MEKWIKLSLPHQGGSERKWVEEAFKDDWIVPLGPNVDHFEQMLDTYLGEGKAVALSAGTAAIHLGLIMLGVKPGDEVICQSLTFAASCNPIKYLGATPVFVDSESESWNMSPTMLERAIKERIKATGRKPKAIVAVDLYGMPARLDEISLIAERYGIPLLEDAAEALGSEYQGRKCGTWGRFGTLSFNGNKIITTSGGGALICHDEKSARKALFYATQAREDRPYYFHYEIGYNYRLSNVSAGIGCGQMEVLPERVARRQAIHRLYSEGLADTPHITVHDNPDERFSSNFWLTTILLDRSIDPLNIRKKLMEKKIETRLLWRPMHMQPVYEDCPYYGDKVSDRLFALGLCLPSGSSLSDDEVRVVIKALAESVGK